MEIAGTTIDIEGDVPDRDLVLLEDAITMIRGKLAGATLHRIALHPASADAADVDGYDIEVSWRGISGRATLRRNARGDWRIRLARELEDAVDDFDV